MKKVLGRKQSMTEADEIKWWNVINHIEDYVSFEEVKQVTQIAYARILNLTRDKKAAYCWSGGKDSLVISELCRNLGIYDCQCFLTDLEFPDWKNFLLTNAPSNCEFIDTGFDLNFLAEHTELLFAEGKLEQFWNKNIRQKFLKKYIHDKNLEVLILGRRIIDGNVCGKDGILRQSKSGIVYSPIYDWSHELLFAFLHYNNIPIPFIYKWRRGFYFGTHLWCERYSYNEVYEIDPSVVIKAAEKIPSAKAFLESLNNASSFGK